MRRTTATAAVAFACAVLALASASKTTTSDLYRYDRGSYGYAPRVPLVRAYGNVFPDALVALLAEECRNTNEWEKGARDPNLKDSTLATTQQRRRLLLLEHVGDRLRLLSERRRVDGAEHPRTAAEMAVAILFHFAFPNGALPAGGIAGGEWWVQRRHTSENIGFHIDKDEGIASEEQWMKMPVLSTVTYLTDVGGPTLVLEQASNRGGNRQEPELPVRGVLVYPKRNRHMLFPGNMQHGVVGEFALRQPQQDGGVGGGSSERITFLVNWWDKKPMSPYCMEISDDTAERHIRANALRSSTAAGSGDASGSGSGSSGFFASWFGGGDDVGDSDAIAETPSGDDARAALWASIQDQLRSGELGPGPGSTAYREEPEPVAVPAGESNPLRRRVDIRTPPTKRYSFPVPKAAADGKTFAGKIASFEWDENEVGGILRQLDPTSRMCWHLFRNLAGLKVIVFRKASDGARVDQDVAYPVAKRFRHSVRGSGGTHIYVADTNGHREVRGLSQRTFGFRRAGGAGAGVTGVGAVLVGQRGAPARYFKMPQRRRGGDLAPTAATILAWVSRLERRDADTLWNDEVKNGKRRKRQRGRRGTNRGAEDKATKQQQQKKKKSYAARGKRGRQGRGGEL